MNNNQNLLFLDENHFELHFQPNHFCLFQWDKQEGGFDRRTIQFIRNNSNDIKRLQYNTTKYINYIIIDIDNNELFNYENMKDVPPPNFIVKNKKKEGGHLFYVLNKTIYGNNEYYKNQWNKIQKYLTYRLNGDKQNIGYIGKNLYNKYLFEYIEINPIAYDLNELNKCVKPFFEQKQFDQLFVVYPQKVNHLKAPNKIAAISRNCEIFEHLRFFAYKKIKESLNDFDFRFNVQIFAKGLNNNYFNPLSNSELNGITKSIIKYCLKHKENIKNFVPKHKMDLDDNLTLKEKQSLGAKYTHQIKEEKTKEKILNSIQYLKDNQLKVNVANINKYSKLNRRTITKYKELFE